MNFLKCFENAFFYNSIFRQSECFKRQKRSKHQKSEHEPNPTLTHDHTASRLVEISKGEKLTTVLEVDNLVRTNRSLRRKD